jgi:hypothetical protein
MSGAEVLAFFEFLLQAAPKVAELVRPIMCEFWQCHVNTPVPPSLSMELDAIDARIDAALRAKHLKP